MFTSAERCIAKLPEAISKSLTACAKPTKRASGRASWACARAACSSGVEARTARSERRVVVMMSPLDGLMDGRHATPADMNARTSHGLQRAFALHLSNTVRKGDNEQGAGEEHEAAGVRETGRRGGHGPAGTRARPEGPAAGRGAPSGIGRTG